METGLMKRAPTHPTGVHYMARPAAIKQTSSQNITLIAKWCQNLKGEIVDLWSDEFYCVDQKYKFDIVCENKILFATSVVWRFNEIFITMRWFPYKCVQSPNGILKDLKNGLVWTHGFKVSHFIKPNYLFSFMYFKYLQTKLL